MSDKEASPPQQQLTIQQALDVAVEHHQAGDLPRAESIYNQILKDRPNHAKTIQLLGVIAHQQGNNEEAIELIEKAITLRPDYAEAHCNLGVALQELGRGEEAIASYKAAINISPNYSSAYYNLGNQLYALTQLNEAAVNFRKAIEIKPDYAEAHNNLGIILRDFNKLDKAFDCCQHAIKLKPDYVDAHLNSGLILYDLGKLEEAVVSYRRVLSIHPKHGKALWLLGNLLADLLKTEEALAYNRRAVALDPEDESVWVALAETIKRLEFTSVDGTLYAELSQLLDHPVVRPSTITRQVLSALRCDEEFSRLTGSVGTELSEEGRGYGDIAVDLVSFPLFLQIMRLSPLHDLEMEGTLTVLRHAMLEEVQSGKTVDGALPFSSALALQCFTNEYVYSETEEEGVAVADLEREIEADIEKGVDVSPHLVVTLGAYRPLYRFSWSGALCDRDWVDEVKEVILRQIQEPREEQSLRSQIPQLTSIDDTVSRSVREQYEENPYPRWFKAGLSKNGNTIASVLRSSSLRFDLGDYQTPENPDVLVAGCGTGQHALETASSYLNAQVLAVDLSLSSLSYALRKTQELGLSNIEYAQADIMELGGLGREFDLIECVGVLHHLGDPLAGWSVLVDLLRPGGLMKVGLYSEVARQHIVAGRSLIAEKGYTSSSEDIRRCREDIIAMGVEGNQQMLRIEGLTDFFNLSECRDLLFHVQEHRFTLPEIEAALGSLKLRFLGFEMQDRRPFKEFSEINPDREALTSLSLWHEFELQNPEVFGSMYQIWCKKE